MNYHLWSSLFSRFDAASRALSWWNRVDQEERSVFCDVIVLVTAIKKFKWTCAWLWMVTEIKLFEYLWFLDLTPLYFCLWSWAKREVYKRKVATWEELLANVLDAASHVKKWGNRSRWAITLSLLTGCKGHWGWWWDFQTFIVNCNKLVIEISN